MNDERQGKPSASGYERLVLCPGSWNLERTLPPLPASEDAASGTRIHAGLAGEPVELTEEEQAMHDRCVALIDAAIKTVFGSVESIDNEAWETRFWLGDRFSGKADYYCFKDDVGLILDAKTGRNEVPTAAGNPQLRALAVLLYGHHGRAFSKIVVGIIQPWSSEPISLCEYDREALKQAEAELVAVLDAADKYNAPRIPGEKQCKWCRALYHNRCPEAARLALAPVDELEAPQLTPRGADALAVSLSNQKLGAMKDRIPIAEAFFAAVDREIKERLQRNPESAQEIGYRLSPGATREVITDPERVFERFTELGGLTADFMPAVTVAKGKLKDAMKKITGAKGKDLDLKLDNLLHGCTETKQNAPSLERIKGEQ